jgi:hypothetical protein
MILDLPGAQSGFSPGHQYNVSVVAVDDGYYSPEASTAFTYGDVGLWGQDCVMNVTPPYLYGGDVVYQASTQCSRTGQGATVWSSYSTGYTVDSAANSFSNNTGSAVCFESAECTVVGTAPAESGTHTYCFLDLQTTFGNDVAENIGGGLSESDAILRINEVNTNSNMCSVLTSG